MKAKIFAVDSVRFYQTKSIPPLLVAHASGRAPTSGWHSATLSPYVYLTPPADGIWDFDFIATTPSGLSRQVLTPIETEMLTLPTPPWFKGIRVHASSNSMESGKSSDTLESTNLVSVSGTTGERRSENSGGEVPFPWTIGANTKALTVSDLLDQPIREVLGKRVRMYTEGDMITGDHFPRSGKCRTCPRN